MCGISGFVGDFPETLLFKMNEVQAHRGPDDAGTLYIEKHRVGLGHRRLAIIDLSEAGHQPMWDHTGKYCIVFNGEIYNYRDLRRDLINNGVSLRSQTDTEVLLNLYIQHGEALFGYLNGIYSFAIWDAEHERLLIARDPLGIKPLYYSQSDRGILFASELKAILCEPSVSRAIDPHAIASYVSFLWCPAPRTPLAAVKKLEPGNALSVKSGRILKQWAFYTPPQQCADREIEPNATSVSMADRLRSAVRTAVERQMVSDVPVGAFLSGGLDSSSIVAFAREFTSQRLQCFTIAFRDSTKAWEGFSEDLPYAQQVAKHLDVDLHTITVGPEMVDSITEMIYHLDEPQADLAPLNTLFICKLARQHHIKVLLSGAGGDDLFTGYRRHLALRLEEYWSWLPQIARKLLPCSASLLPTSVTAFRRLRKAVENAHLPANERLLGYFYWLNPLRAVNLLHSELREKVSLQEISAPLNETLRNTHSSCRPIDKMLLLETRYFLADHNLNYTDKMSMAVGVEARVPLLDLDLVSLADRISDRYKQRGRTGKWIFKKAMEPILPSSVIYRPKTGFGVPLRYWMKGPLADMIHEKLSQTALERTGLFDPAAVASLMDADRRGSIDGSYPLFAILAVQCWHEKFLAA